MAKKTNRPSDARSREAAGKVVRRRSYAQAKLKAAADMAQTTRVHTAAFSELDSIDRAAKQFPIRVAKSAPDLEHLKRENAVPANVGALKHDYEGVAEHAKIEADNLRHGVEEAHAYEERAAKDALRAAVKSGAGFTDAEGDDYTQEARDAVAKDLREQRALTAAARTVTEGDKFTGGGIQPHAGMPGWDEKSAKKYHEARRLLENASREDRGAAYDRAGQKRVPKGQTTGGRWTK